MKIYMNTQAEAYAEANAMHEYLVANDSVYAESVALGHTKAWCVPQETPKGWEVIVDSKSENGMTEIGKAKLEAEKSKLQMDFE